MTKDNQEGFQPATIILCIAITVAVGLAGWAAWTHHSDITSSATNSKKAEVKPVVSTTATYDPAKVANIKNFDKASPSIKAALINDFYDHERATATRKMLVFLPMLRSHKLCT